MLNFSNNIKLELTYSTIGLFIIILQYFAKIKDTMLKIYHRYRNFRLIFT